MARYFDNSSLATTELHEAVKAGDIGKVQQLLNTISPNATNIDMYTPLHRAVECDNLEMTRLLLTQGADPDASHPGLDGWTPLHLACWKKSPKMIQLLLEHRANADALDWYGQTPFDWAPADCMHLLQGVVKKEDDPFWQLRSTCKMVPSQLHLTNIERACRGAKEFDPAAQSSTP